MSFLASLAARVVPRRGDLPAITVVLGDIARQRVDAVVNAADETLLGGTGVDGALHAAAGPALAAACLALGGCRTGHVKSTPGFGLPATHVIHAVAPVHVPSGSAAVDAANEEALAACFTKAIREADRLGCRTLAFPALGAGAFGWHPDDVARVAAGAFRGPAARSRHVREVRLVAFDRRTFRAFEEAAGVAGTVDGDPSGHHYHAGVSAT